jgi:hypothetical protein
MPAKAYADKQIETIVISIRKIDLNLIIDLLLLIKKPSNCV